MEFSPPSAGVCQISLTKSGCSPIRRGCAELEKVAMLDEDMFPDPSGVCQGIPGCMRSFPVNGGGVPRLSNWTSIPYGMFPVNGGGVIFEVGRRRSTLSKQRG